MAQKKIVLKPCRPGFESLKDAIKFELSKLHNLAIGSLTGTDRDKLLSVVSSRILDLVWEKFGDDIELGKQTRKQRRTFVKDHAKKPQKEREGEREKWRAADEQLKKSSPRLAGSRMKTKRAKRIKKKLGIKESVETIRKRI